ncbi:protein OBERON 3-like [Chenopodium quinoa]|uniref:protein OBERON 3-like n=1 Tax=Chenopodium quinoa TaxID=63459 RepID=UPI000B78A6AA|nr:protein OBERON 3-like [Chenopodium quinoa]
MSEQNHENGPGPSGCSPAVAQGQAWKEVLENSNQEEKWVERDFLQLRNSDGGTSKREAQEDVKREGDGWKKPKLETQTLDLSLALPDVSLSLSASNAAPPNCDAVVRPKPCRSVQSLALSDNNNNNNNNTQVTCSDDFTAASLSYSYSHPFSHNPSCSLTQNSTEYYENSVGSRRRDWNCGEGTNGSVHSRFKPIGDGVSLSNHGSSVAYTMLNRSRTFNKDPGNSLYRAAASDTSSFFPSELPAKPRTDLCSVDSMSKSLDQGLNNLEDMRGHKLSRGERIVRDVITEHTTVMSQLSRELPAEAIESAKEYLNCLMASPERKDELAYLQNLLEKRSDLTMETLSKSDRLQLEILVAVKFGLNEFVSGKARLPTSELAEIFFFQRCRNIICKSSLPVDDCDCKVCSTKKGFCSQCMCSVCYNYDCANNTCSWVGCDACSHWCHASCGAENNLIRPGPSLKRSSGKTEMQFYCLGCGHASEMFGFVKDVFIFCAKDWGIQTLIKELDCVRRIFKGSEDLKGKELYLKAAELLTRLERRAISPSDACHVIIHFFTTKSDKDDTADYAATGVGANELTASQKRRLDDVFPSPSSNLAQKSSFINSATMLQGLRSYDFHQSSPKPNLSSERQLAIELSGKLSNKDGFDSLESIIRLKETEARMFQNRADEARKEVNTYRQLVETKTEKLDVEYSEKLAKLCLQEAEERRRKRLEELRILENTHSGYYKMKIRMQAEISVLVERMEATKQLWV